MLIFLKQGFIIDGMKYEEIAQKMGYTPMFVYYLIKGDRFTTDFNLAEMVSKHTKEPAINYISPKLRNYYKRLLNNG